MLLETGEPYTLHVQNNKLELREGEQLEVVAVLAARDSIGFSATTYLSAVLCYTSQSTVRLPSSWCVRMHFVQGVQLAYADIDVIKLALVCHLTAAVLVAAGPA